MLSTHLIIRLVELQLCDVRDVVIRSPARPRTRCRRPLVVVNGGDVLLPRPPRRPAAALSLGPRVRVGGHPALLALALQRKLAVGVVAALQFVGTP